MIERRKGTIQRQRSNSNLLHPEFKIDQRSFEDILAYIVAYVEHVNFFDSTHKIDGNWKTLIEQDPVIFCIGIIKAPVTNLHFEKASQADHIKLLLDWYDTIEQWYHRLLYFKTDLLADKIGNVLRDVLQDKKTALLNAQQKTTASSTAQQPTLAAPPKEKPDAPVDLDDVTHTFRKMILYIQNFTSQYLERNVFAADNHMPNNAMYITFAILFHNIQDQMNAIGQKHLDFYYKDILQQTPSEGIPTQTVVCFELTPKSKGILIPSHTPLNAGKLFEHKQNIEFETDKPLEVVPIKIEALDTLYFNTSPFVKIGTHRPTIASILKTERIKNGSPVAHVPNQALFGANEDNIITSTISKDTLATIGCIIASPVLFLEEGERDITITFNLEPTSAKATLWRLLHEMAQTLETPLDSVFNTTFERAFCISYSTAKDWVTLSKYRVRYNEAACQFTIQFTLDITHPPLEASTQHTETSFPMVKIVLDPYAPVYTYSFFRRVAVDSVTIDAHVKGVKNLSLYNTVGKMPLTKAFHLFGAAPTLGSYIMVGKSELFKKELTALNITIAWDNLPVAYGGFDTYYNAYEEGITNTSFQVDIKALSHGVWFPKTPSKTATVNLFDTVPAVTPEGYETVVLSETTTIAVSALDQYKLSRDYHQKDPIPYDVHTHSGFFKLEFKAPKYAFGKSVYHKNYSAVVRYNAQNEDTKPLPNPPFIPKVKQVTLAYAATDTIYFNNAFDNSSESVQGSYMHISPFGTETIVKDSRVYKNTMFSDFDGSGYLYLKLSKLERTQTLSLFFDLVNDTPINNTHANNISIEYKKMGRWIQLPSKNIITDGTAQLSTSGIIELVLPYFETKRMATNYELRFVAQKEAYTYPKMHGIYLNAVQAHCTSTDENVLGKIVPAYSIHKPIRKIAELKKIIQPAHSYGGKTPASSEHFYTNVSERLKHKDRALTLWDFEHLILERFHHVIAVKCTNLNRAFKPRAGQVRLVVMSNKWTHHAHHYFSTETLNSIHQFIKRKANPFITITVQNPKVEWLLVNCFATFEAEDQGGYYRNALNTEISAYLCPLSHSDSTTIEGIGAIIIPRMLRSHIENLPYIATVKQLEIEHIVKKGLDNFTVKIYKESEEIAPTTPWSILAPKSKHNIYNASILDAHSSAEVDNDNLQIGVDYIIASDHEAPPPDSPNTETAQGTPTATKPKSTLKKPTILNFKLE